MLARLNQYLLLMGIPGLFVISFLDSAAAPVPGGPDALVILFAWHQPALTYLVVLAATIGSTLGCLVLYGIGKKGGKKALSRFKPEKIAWIENCMQKRGAWTVLVSVLAPPPFPAKLAILAAGVMGVNRSQFCLGVFAGRLVRYSFIGYLAAHFGGGTTRLLKDYYPMISLVIIGIILLVLLIRNLKTERAA